MSERQHVPTRRRSPRRARRLRLLLLALGIGSALVMLEGLLQLAPGILPASFRQRFPPNGVEFFAPGVLDRTPLTALPLPYGVQAFDGPPPHDLVAHGLATSVDAAADRAAVPRLVIPADADGLPNAQRPARPDAVLVGDSFTLFAAAREPIGLQLQLERALGIHCLNLGVAGIGPIHELFLLERVGLSTPPKLVLWFFYGGNDLVDAFWVGVQQQQGITTLGELFHNRRVPTLLVPAWIASWFGGAAESPLGGPLPPFVLAAAPAIRMWFYPDNLRVLSLPTAVLRDNPGWTGTADALRRAHAASLAAGAAFLLVYLPSKEQVYVPWLSPDPELLARCARLSPLAALPMAATPAQFHADLLANRTAVEQLLQQICQREGIPMWSASAALDALAAAGTAGYYATDTHWNPAGQAAVAPGLIERLRQTGLFGQ